MTNIFTAKENGCIVKIVTPSYITLEDEYPVEDIKFSVYTETPGLLEEIEDAPSEEVYYHSAYLSLIVVLLHNPIGVMFISI
jgi:hypothetical protein